MMLSDVLDFQKGKFARLTEEFGVERVQTQGADLYTLACARSQTEYLVFAQLGVTMISGNSFNENG